MGYRKHSANNCPKCKSEQISGAQVEIHDTTVTQDLVCISCEHEWSNIYKLVEVDSKSI